LVNLLLKFIIKTKDENYIPLRHNNNFMQLQNELDASNEKNEYLLEQFRLAQQKNFGASSEAHPGQGELFNEAEVEDDKIDSLTP